MCKNFKTASYLKTLWKRDTGFFFYFYANCNDKLKGKLFFASFGVFR